MGRHRCDGIAKTAAYGKVADGTDTDVTDADVTAAGGTSACRGPHAAGHGRDDRETCSGWRHGWRRDEWRVGGASGRAETGRGETRTSGGMRQAGIATGGD